MSGITDHGVHLFDRLLLSILLFPIIAFADTESPFEVRLETPRFMITIIERCGDASLLCDDVSYIGVSKKTNRKITIRGSKNVRWCSGGDSPCEALGYIFFNGDTVYEVSRDGRLTVSKLKTNKILVEEQGRWIRE